MIKVEMRQKRAKVKNVGLKDIEAGRWFEYGGGLYMKLSNDEYYSTNKDLIYHSPFVHFPYINYVNITRIECEEI